MLPRPNLDEPPAGSDEARLLARLRKVGKAPAAFYRDAWKMFVADDLPLETRAHMVAHALREVESALRDVLLPASYVPPPGCSACGEVKSAHKMEITAILDFYGLSEDSEAARLWDQLAGRLHGLAHRAALGAPRSVHEVKEAWLATNRLLTLLLDALDNKYFTIYDRIDALLAKPHPTKADRTEFLNRVPLNAVTYSYFFSKLRTRGWLTLLAAKGVFTNPPEAGFWPQSEYLVRAAADTPKEVARIVGSLHATPNPLIHVDIMRTAALLPQSLRDAVVEREADFFRVQPRISDDIADEAGRLITTLVSTGAQTPALHLAESLLMPSATPVGKRWEPRFDGYTYESLLKTIRQAFDDVTVVDLLTQVTEVMVSHEHGSSRTDVSPGWRPSIEDHQQNHFHAHDVRNSVIDALRDACVNACTADPSFLEKFVQRCHASRWTILRRLALHLIRVAPTAPISLAEEWITNAEIVAAHEFRRELHLLVSAKYGSISAEAQRQFLDLVGRGPAIDLNRVDEEEATGMRERWQRTRLSWVAPFLSGATSTRYEELVARHGEADEKSDFFGWMSFQAGTRSPVSVDHLRSLTVDALVGFLKSWRSERGFQMPTREGLGHRLQESVKVRADEISGAAGSFIDLHPTYIAAVIGGLDEAIRQNDENHVRWDAVLTLAEWAVGQRAAVELDEDDLLGFGGWEGVHIGVARLVEDGLSRDQIPFELRTRVWRILASLADHQDPSPDHELSSNMDPLTLSLNSVRGVVFHGVMQYAMWCTRNGIDVGDGEFGCLNEVREYLETHLDPHREPSACIRAMFGEYLYYFCGFARKWVEAHLDQIFPPAETRLRRAAWETFLVHGRWNDAVFALLQPQYRSEAACAATKSLFFEQSNVILGRNLLLQFVYGHSENAAGSALHTFFAAADDETKREALGHTPYAVQEASDEDIIRLTELWAWRQASATETELRAFGSWFTWGHFADEWRLGELESVLERTKGAVDREHVVVEQLTGLSEAAPAAVGRCFAQICRASNGFSNYAWLVSGKMESIFSRAIKTGDEPTIARITQTINWLSSGNPEYLRLRPLLESSLAAAVRES